jgi:radical SAM superfamily enzyme YgiQ (UPF0313 family)
MKLLLVAINASYIHTNLAVYSIASYLGNPPDVEIAEYNINTPAAEIMADIYAREPGVVAFSCYIWNWGLVGYLLRELPKIMPAVAVWLGGPEVSHEAEEIMRQYPAVTGIILGEGEETWAELYAVGATLAPTSEGINKIKGLIYRTDTGVIFRASPRDPLNINNLRFPYPDLSSENLAKRIVYYESSRGCPYQCAYCLSAASEGVRYKDMAKVQAELAVFLAQKVAQVKFCDRTFNAKHEHALAVWQYIKENDTDVTNFHFEIAADLLTPTEITLLQNLRPGLVQLEIGVQSTHPPTLSAINRQMDFAKVQAAVTALRQNNNLHLHLDLIAGLPCENYDTFVSSFNDVYALKAHAIQLGFLKILPGTPLKREAKELGIIYEETPPYQVLQTKWLDYAELQKLHQIAEMVEVFHNSHQYENTLAVLELAFPNPFSLYEKLAEFFAERDGFRRSPARASRYQLLLDFACAYDSANRNCFRELLTHDLFRREKAARPDFAPDLSAYREQIKEMLKGHGNRQAAVEVYCYSVDAENTQKKLVRSDRPRFLLYDYCERDAVTKNVKCYEVNPHE